MLMNADHAGCMFDTAEAVEECSAASVLYNASSAACHAGKGVTFFCGIRDTAGDALTSRLL
jgi:hypothetical protein